MVGHEARMAALDAGAAAENVYLYCASEGINVVERMLFDSTTFAGIMGLPKSYNFMLAMTAATHANSNSRLKLA